MDNITIGLLSVFAILILIYAGMHIGVALTLLSFVGVWLIRDLDVASQLIALASNDVIADHVFGVIPLFVLMGLVVAESGIGKDTFAVADQLFRRVRGGLGIATVAGNTVFAAVTGLSIASAAVFTKVAVPEMLRYGYAPRFAVGVVAGSSILGSLIPPSLLLILYGVLTEKSIGDLFIAGIVPGLVLAFIYVIFIMLATSFWPSYAGKPNEMVRDGVQLMSAWHMALNVLPVVLLVLLVLGGIYGGIFTTTESGAVGAAGSLCLAIAKRRMSLQTLWKVLVETASITAAICFLIISATVYSRMLAISGVGGALTELLAGSSVGLWTLLTLFILVVLVSGSILDSSSIMLIAIPLILPALKNFNVDLIWFGIVNLLALEIGLLTPPFGLSIFVVKATLTKQTPISLGDIFIGAAPFAVMIGLVMLLVLAFPKIATVLI